METDAPVVCQAGTSGQDAEHELEGKGGLGVVLLLQADLLFVLWLPSSFCVIHSPFSAFSLVFFFS